MKLWWYNQGHYGYVVRAPDARTAALTLWGESWDVRSHQYRNDPATFEALAGMLVELTAQGQEGIVEHWTSL